MTPPVAVDAARWLLVRRSRRDRELAFYACFAPASTSLLGLVQVAGIRWAVEEASSRPKWGGLDHYQLRRWPGCYRHITLVLLAHAFLAVTRARARAATTDRAKGDAAALPAGLACCRSPFPRSAGCWWR